MKESVRCRFHGVTSNRSYICERDFFIAVEQIFVITVSYTHLTVAAGHGVRRQNSLFLFYYKSQ